jgi:long-subunit fatty acid transport protein
VNLVLTRPLSADWTVHGNLGWTRDRPYNLDSTTWAVAAEWAASETWTVGAETYGDDRNKPWLGVGARWTLSKAWSVNASYAVNHETPRTSAASVGFKFVFI